MTQDPMEPSQVAIELGADQEEQCSIEYLESDFLDFGGLVLGKNYYSEPKCILQLLDYLAFSIHVATPHFHPPQHKNPWPTSLILGSSTPHSNPPLPRRHQAATHFTNMNQELNSIHSVGCGDLGLAFPPTTKKTIGLHGRDVSPSQKRAGDMT